MLALLGMTGPTTGVVDYSQAILKKIKQKIFCPEVPDFLPTVVPACYNVRGRQRVGQRVIGRLKATCTLSSLAALTSRSVPSGLQRKRRRLRSREPRTASVQTGRGFGRSRPSTPEGGHKPNRPRMDTMTLVHAIGPSGPAEVLEGHPTEPACGRTKPERYTRQSTSENISVLGVHESAFAPEYAPADRLIRWPTGRASERSRNITETKGVPKICRPKRGGKIACGAADQPESPSQDAEAGGDKQTKPECYRK